MGLRLDPRDTLEGPRQQILSREQLLDVAFAEGADALIAKIAALPEDARTQ